MQKGAKGSKREQKGGRRGQKGAEGGRREQKGAEGSRREQKGAEGAKGGKGAKGQELCDEHGNVDRGSLGWRNVACGFGHWGEDLIEGLSWTIGVVLLDTFGVILLSCACIVHSSHLPTGRTATREPEVARQPSCMTLRSMRPEIINHVKERTWSLSWYCGDQLWQLMVMLSARCCRDTLVQFLRRIAIMSVDQTMCS